MIHFSEFTVKMTVFNVASFLNLYAVACVGTHKVHEHLRMKTSSEFGMLQDT